MNKAVISMSKELGIKLIATNDVHYVLKEDADVHDVLLCMQVNQKITKENRFKFPTQDYWNRYICWLHINRNGRNI